MSPAKMHFEQVPVEVVKRITKDIHTSGTAVTAPTTRTSTRRSSVPAKSLWSNNAARPKRGDEAKRNG
jgi:hypothetical protein